MVRRSRRRYGSRVQMTNDERAQVVELLECAADLRARGSYAPLFDAYDELAWPPESRIAELAAEAVLATTLPMSIEQLLEAAARVRDNSWP